MAAQREIPECYRWANDLKVGDTVFVDSRSGLSKSKVTHLTATQIVIGDHNCRYQRTSLSRRIDSWSSDDLKQVTPEREARYLRQQQKAKIFSLAHDIYNKIKRSSIDKLTNEGVTELCATLQGVVNELDDRLREK